MEDYTLNMIAIGWWQVGIASCTLIALIVYAWDTRRLRKVAELQQRANREQVDIMIAQHQILMGQLKESVPPLFSVLQVDTPESFRLLITFLNKGGKVKSIRYRSEQPTVESSRILPDVVENSQKVILDLTSENPTLQALKEGSFYLDYTDSLGREQSEQFDWVFSAKSVKRVE